jgi:hypothetical protein
MPEQKPIPAPQPPGLPAETNPDLVAGALTTEVKEVDGFQEVPRIPGHPRETEDFNPDGTVKNPDIEEYQRQERAALLGEAVAPPWSPATERRITEAAIAAKEGGVAPVAPADQEPIKPDTVSVVSTMTPRAPVDEAAAADAAAPADADTAKGSAPAAPPPNAATAPPVTAPAIPAPDAGKVPPAE